MVGVIAVWSVENYIHLRETKWRLQPVENYFSNTSTDYIKILEDQGYTTKEFQAILGLPYFHIGSEKMALHRDGMAFVNAAKLSYQTGLPMVQSHMSRASVNQTTKAIQLMSDSLIPKEIIAELPNKKPLLLVVANKEYFKSETNLIDKAKLIYQTKGLRLLELPISAFHTTLSKERLLADYERAVYWNSYENSPQKISYTGSGSFYKEQGDVELISWKTPQDSTALELSFWIFIEPTVYGMPEIEIQLLKDNTVLETKKMNTQILTDIHQSWLKVTHEFVATPKADKIKVIAKGNPYWVDDFMIRKSDIDTYVIEGQTIKKNNFIILE